MKKEKFISGNNRDVSVFDFGFKNRFVEVKNWLKNRNMRRLGLIGGIFVLSLVLVVSFSFASLTPIKTVEIYSSSLNYENNDAGAWKVTKSSEWIDEATANIHFDVDSILRPVNSKTDVILVLDNSASMTENKMLDVRKGVKKLVNTLFDLDENNKVALISFNTDATILSDFTRDNTVLEKQVDNLLSEGNTNYYQALNKVDEVLNDYVAEDGRSCIVLFFTDGYPNVEIPNEIVKASELKSKYSYVTINSISYDMGELTDSVLERISDKVYSAEVDNVEDVFFEASVGLVPYSSFVLSDYINSEYFDVTNITLSMGEVKITEENGNKKITWDLGNNYLSGTWSELDVEIKLKDEYLNTAGIFQTNIQEVITSTIGEIDENVTSSLTPIIADNYMVTYDGNAPEDCTVMGIPEAKNHSVFTTVEITDVVPTCSGYNFKGWKVSGDNVTMVGTDYFVMPEDNVVLKAEWANVKLAKSIDGSVFEIKPLYDVIAANSVPDNIASEYVTASTGIDFSSVSSDTNGKGIYMMASTAEDDYPIYYYRGAVENNNVKFADFCWKIVRTTDTGGVKLIYNGLPDSNGGCTNTTGEATTIGQSAFNSLGNSLAYVGYMYGGAYPSYLKTMLVDYHWIELSGKEVILLSNISSTNYYYSDSVTVSPIENTDGYLYILDQPVNYLWSSNYDTLEGKYTCLSETNTGCTTVYYVTSTTEGIMRYIEMNGMETYDTIINDLNTTNWIYGNDVEYSDGKYTLIDTYESAPGSWTDDYTTIASKYHYTCFSNSSTCEEVHYIYGINTSSPYNGAYEVSLSDGKKIGDIVKEMLDESSNENDSTIKSFVDSWYKDNLISFTDLLEDTVWCNDRSIKSYGGWDKDTNAIISLSFDFLSKSPNLYCNLNDSFTVEETYKNGVQIGNGFLTYPTALLTADEANLAGGKSDSVYLYNGVQSWSMSIRDFSATGFIPYQIPLGSASWGYSSLYVRPSISLKAGTKALSGDGTANNPYVMD